jgi:CRISPR-associated protein Cmr5
MRTLDQIRAEFAWRRVQNPTKEYRNLAKSLPALVMSNGLMQTLAFLEAKGKDEHKRLSEDILSWLADQQTQVLSPNEQEQGFEAAMKRLAEMDSLAYQRATEEALAILRWIRHLADTL